MEYHTRFSNPKTFQRNVIQRKNKILSHTTLPADFDDTVSKVVTPSVVLPGTESTSIQKETQEMTTIRMVGT